MRLFESKSNLRNLEHRRRGEERKIRKKNRQRVINLRKKKGIRRRKTIRKTIKKTIKKTTRKTRKMTRKMTKRRKKRGRRTKERKMVNPDLKIHEQCNTNP